MAKTKAAAANPKMIRMDIMAMEMESGRRGVMGFPSFTTSWVTPHVLYARLI